MDHSTWFNNPQYQFSLQQSSLVTISLQQKEARLFGYQYETDFDSCLSIGFHLLKVEKNRNSRIHQKIGLVKGTNSFINSRQISNTLQLQQGNYVIIPATYTPGLDGDFLLRVYSSTGCRLNELHDEIPREILNNSSNTLIVSLWINSMSLHSKGIHLDSKYSIQCSTDNNQKFNTIEIESLNPEYDEGYLLYFNNNRNSKIQLDVFKSSRLKKDKLISSYTLSLQKILTKPVNTFTKSKIILTKLNDTSEIGWIEIIYSYHNNPNYL